MLGICREDDTNWPQKSVVGKQELEVRLGSTHISFELAKLGSLVDVQQSEDSEGLRYVDGRISRIDVRQALTVRSFTRTFYYLIQDLRVSFLVGMRIYDRILTCKRYQMFVFSLISLHFKIKPTP